MKNANIAEETLGKMILNSIKMNVRLKQRY
jgi:hypothetical protein